MQVVSLWLERQVFGEEKSIGKMANKTAGIENMVCAPFLYRMYSTKRRTSLSCIDKIHANHGHPKKLDYRISEFNARRRVC